MGPRVHTSPNQGLGLPTWVLLPSPRNQRGTWKFRERCTPTHGASRGAGLHEWLPTFPHPL